MSQMFDFSDVDLRGIRPGSPLADVPGKGGGLTSSMMSSPLNYEKLLSDLARVKPSQNISPDAQGFLDSLTSVKRDGVIDYDSLAGGNY